MSQKIFKVHLNTLKILEWEPEFSTHSDENFSAEPLLRHLCHTSVPSAMEAFRKRYAEVSKYDQHLRFAVAEPKISENLYGPLRQGKMNYVLGNYASSITLCGIVAEMIALLVFILLKKPSKTKLKRFQKKRQHDRIKILRDARLINRQSEDDFNRIKGARNSLLHRWRTPDERIAKTAVEIYAATARLAFDTIFVREFRSGKAILPPALMEYLEEEGAIVQMEERE